MSVSSLACASDKPYSGSNVPQPGPGQTNIFANPSTPSGYSFTKPGTEEETGPGLESFLSALKNNEKRNPNQFGYSPYGSNGYSSKKDNGYYGSYSSGSYGGFSDNQCNIL